MVKQECQELQNDLHWLHKAVDHLRDIPRSDANEKAKNLEMRAEQLENEIDVNELIRKSSGGLTMMLVRTSLSAFYFGIVHEPLTMWTHYFLFQMNKMFLFVMLPFYVSMIATLLLIIFYGEDREDFKDETAPYMIFGVLAGLQVVLTSVYMYLFMLRETALWVLNKYKGSTLEERVGKLMRNLRTLVNVESDEEESADKATQPSKSSASDFSIHAIPPLQSPPEPPKQRQQVKRVQSVFWPKAWLVVGYFVAALLGKHPAIPHFDLIAGVLTHYAHWLLQRSWGSWI